MKNPGNMPRLKGFRYPRDIIACAVWACHRFALSTADLEDLPAERGVIVSREAVRLWVNRFGRYFACCIRRDRPQPDDKWHPDEVVITIRGVKHWLWRAIDADGDDHLVRMPFVVWLRTVSPNAASEIPPETVHPKANSFAADNHTPLGWQVFNVSRAQGKAMTGPNRTSDDITGIAKAFQAR